MEKKALVADFVRRGVENVIPSVKELEELLLSEKKLNVYMGIDPTATRIHLGHAVPLRKLQTLAELGHTVRFLIGDFTAKIGDTSDKESERPMLTDEEILENFAQYKEMASKVIDFEKVEVVHNSEWLSKLGFAEILKVAGNFSVNDFVSRELIRKRLDAGKRVSLPETLYPLMQGYDSYHLDTDIQLGATDQTFNMQAGRTLQKRMRNKESYVLAVGYLSGTDGRKMSKSWGNAIWLNDSPEEMYGKLMRINDAVMEEYWTLSTNVPLSEVKEKVRRIEKGENPMVVKRELAHEIVDELYGGKAAEKARAHFDKTVVNKEAAVDTKEIEIKVKKISVSMLPSMLKKWGVIGSSAEGKRLLKQGGVYFNDKRVEMESEELVLKTGENVFRLGKRKYLKLRKA